MSQGGPPNPYLENYRSVVWRAECEKWTSLFDLQVRHAGIPAPVPEYRFYPVRRWRIDRAWPLDKVGVEIDGGIWRRGGGAHSHPANIQRDMEKLNAAVLLGWRVLRFSEVHLNSPYAMERVKEALKGGLSWTSR